MIERLCIIGVGLIGGSLGLALRNVDAKRVYCKEIVGVGRNLDNLQEAVRRGAVDRYECDIGRAVSGADVVFMATPLDTFRSIFAAIKDHIAPETVITDGGSAKACVFRDAEIVFGRIPVGLVPGHPIAGTEKSGVAAALVDLYRGRRVLLTPCASTDRNAIKRVRQMWETAGACVEEMDAEHHDNILAATSHLPHILAFGLVDSLVRSGNAEEIFRYAAGGFRDFTRIASSDPVMWRDICLHNQAAILQVLQRYRADLDALSEAIRQSDGDALQALFSRAKVARDKFCY